MYSMHSGILKGLSGKSMWETSQGDTCCDDKAIFTSEMVSCVSQYGALWSKMDLTIYWAIAEQLQAYSHAP